MSWKVAMILTGVWILGVVNSYTLGGFINVLLVVSVIIVLTSVMSAEKAL